jgi:cell division protein FtsA
VERGPVQGLFGGVLARLRRRHPGEAAGPAALTALDVGTEFAKALVVAMEPAAGGDGIVAVVRGAGRQRQGLSHMQSGTVTDIDAVVANCREALDEAEAQAGLKPRAAVIGIAGELVKGTTSWGTVKRADPKLPLSEAELERIVTRVQGEALDEAERRIAWESGVERLDVRLVHAAIVEIKIDGYGVSNPIGFTGAQVELAVFNAFAPMVHLGALQSVAHRLGLELLGVIAEPYAVATCLDPGEMGDAGAIFVDVGGGTTDVALVRQGGIAGTKMLALGGRAFTRGLAERFGLSFTRAEMLKLAAAADELPESVPQESLRDALAEDAAVWRRGVELMIADLADGELLPARIYLCGGGAELPQIAGVLGEDGWWKRLPFSRRPQVLALGPDDVLGLRDGTGELSTQQDVTPMALANQALVLDARTSAADRAMRQAVRSMSLAD